MRSTEWDIIFTLIQRNTYESLSFPTKFLDRGWWSASAICKHSIFKSGRTNVPPMIFDLIHKHNLVEKEEIHYKAHRRPRTKVMFRLKPRMKGKIFNLVIQKQISEFTKNQKISSRFAPMALLQSQYFQNGKKISEWLSIECDNEIERLKAQIQLMKSLKRLAKEVK